jgi:hypothetical protein
MAIIPVQSPESRCVRVSASTIVGALEPIQEIYTSDDVISSDIADELIKLSSIPTTCLNLYDIAVSKDNALTPEQQCQLRSLLDEFSDIFALSDAALGQTDLVQHTIELTDPKPIR